MPGKALHHGSESAVTRQLVSDVPLGSFLSGGMDSGSIVAVASRRIDRLMTFTGGFDGFPMFSPDGNYLVFGSNRNESHPGNTNVFIAEWVEGSRD